MKCIVGGCKNHRHEGRFIGNICAPCHNMLTTGKIGLGETFIHALHEDLKQMKLARAPTEYKLFYNMKLYDAHYPWYSRLVFWTRYFYHQLTGRK